MQKQQMLADFNNLCKGDLDKFKERFKKDFNEYSYFLYRQKHSENGNVWDVKVEELDQKEVHKQAISQLKEKATELKYEDFLKFFNDFDIQ